MFDVDMDHDPPYLVMEYVDGVSLQAAVARAGTFAVGEAAAVGVQVGDGLARAGAVGLVHRDIKPANILLDRRGSVKILDLGIVRFTHDDTFSHLHAAEVILGTIDYLAPEQAEDSSKVDIRADLYGLGATLYFLLAGHPPFPGSDVRRKLAAKRTEDPPPIHQLRPDVPEGFSAVVQRLLARAPADRFPTAGAAGAALHPWVAPGPDFPARLFRVSSDSTAHERRNTIQADSDPMPDTLRIIKPLARSEPANPSCFAENPPGADRAAHPDEPAPERAPEEPNPADLSEGTDPSPTDEIRVPPAADTDSAGTAAALTDEAIAVPPELLLLDLNARPPSAGPPSVRLPRPVPRPRAGRNWPAVIGLVLAALALSAGAAALIWLAGR
jgi:serine/threonine-protein kinase